MFVRMYSCTKCGASDYFERKGSRICSYCRSKFTIQTDDLVPVNSTIALEDDVLVLLQKCKEDPENTRRYASLALDIDPNNVEALKLLKQLK